MNPTLPIKSDLYNGQLSFSDGTYFATIVDTSSQKFVLSGEQIKWGITWESSPIEIGKIDPTQFQHFVCYPRENPKTLWLYEDISFTANPIIKRALTCILEARECQGENAIAKYNNALEMMNGLKGPNEATQIKISKFFLTMKKDAFFVQMECERDLYLSEKGKTKFNWCIEDYKGYVDPEIIFKCFSELVGGYSVMRKEGTRLKRYQCLTAAITYDFSNNPISAVESYLQLLREGLPHSSLCMEKIKTILKNTRSDPYAFINVLEKIDRNLLTRLVPTDPKIEKFLKQKDALRMEFEKSLEKIKNHPDLQRKEATCFICFALEEDVTPWLTKTFVPDLEKTGIKPIFGPWHLSHLHDLSTFQSKIRNSDLVIAVCTSRLREKCKESLEEQTKGITGSAAEIMMAKQRFNDNNKHNTISLLHLKGKREECIPTEMLEPNFSTTFTILDQSDKNNIFSYYSKAIRLFTSLRSSEDLSKAPEPLSSKIAGEIEQDFYTKAESILKN